MLNKYTFILIILYFSLLITLKNQSSIQAGYFRIKNVPSNNKILDRLKIKRNITSADELHFTNFLSLEATDQEFFIEEELKGIEECKEFLSISRSHKSKRPINQKHIQEMEKKLIEHRKKLAIYLDLYGENYHLEGMKFTSLKRD